MTDERKPCIYSLQEPIRPYGQGLCNWAETHVIPAWAALQPGPSHPIYAGWCKSCPCYEEPYEPGLLDEIMAMPLTEAEEDTKIKEWVQQMRRVVRQVTRICEEKNMVRDEPKQEESCQTQPS